MAGGTWTVQNKTRPGVYIDFDSVFRPSAVPAERGVAAMALSLGWGPSKRMLAIRAGDDVRDVLGYDLSSPALLLVREALKRAGTLLLYRLNTGVKATATIGNLTATAKYGGSRGNDIRLVVRPNVDDSSRFDVLTLVDDKEVDRQTVADVGELTGNAWVDFSGSGALTPTAATALSGGADGTATGEDHADFLAEAELHDFQTIALPATDPTLKAMYAAFARRLREQEGKKIQVVLENYPEADYEGVISVKNGVVLADGTALTAAQATAWVAGATAGASVDRSLTYTPYDDAVDANPRYPHAQIEEALLGGEFVFSHSYGRAVVEQDINSLHTFTAEKGKAFSKNRVVRVLDAIANDLRRLFEERYVGRTDNDEDGRNLFRSECLAYLNALGRIGAVRDIDAETDVVVSAGEQPDAVVVELRVRPVDSVEKIYMKVRVG